MTSIEDRLNRIPEPWKPNPGDHLIGTVVTVTTRTNDYGEYPVITIEANGNEWDFHGYHTVARRELEQQNPQPGDQIGIRYLGKPDDKPYEQYRIIVERPNIGSAIDPEEEPF